MEVVYRRGVNHAATPAPPVVAMKSGELMRACLTNGAYHLQQKIGVLNQRNRMMASGTLIGRVDIVGGVGRGGFSRA